MAGSEIPPGLLALPDIAHEAVAGFCRQREHLLMMSTSTAAMGTFGTGLRALKVNAGRRYRCEEQEPESALLRLLRRLPNLKRLEWEYGAVDALSRAIIAGGWCGGLVELDLRGARGAEGLGAAIGTGNLPSLQRLRTTSDGLHEISTGLIGGASPRLAVVQSRCTHGSMVAFVEALEARMALGCCYIRHLTPVLEGKRGDWDAPNPWPDALRRACSSPALAKLQALVFYGLVDDEEVCPVS
jgi:hypothetical protein